MEYHFNQPERLPPVGCWLLIQLPDGSTLKVRRTGYIASKDRLMSYQMEDGTIINARFRWTYT